MSNFVDLFDQASLDARWAGSAATLDDVNDRVDLSVGSLVAVTGTLNSTDFAALNFEFEFTPQLDYQNLYVILPRTNSSPRCRININSGGADAGSRTAATFRMAFVAASFGSFGGSFGPAAASVTMIDGLNKARVTRSSSGAWEMFLNDVSVGTGQEPAGVTTYYDTPANVTGEIDINQTGFYLNSLSVLPASNVNSDPVLDSAIPDVSVPANTSGTILDVSQYVSDADGDPLTYGVTPSLPTGMVLNTSTGIVTGNGAISEISATDFTFTADDGQGGTAASDVVSIEVTAAVANKGFEFYCYDAGNANAVIASESIARLIVYNDDGSTEFLNLTNISSDVNGKVIVDSESLGAVGSTGVCVAWRTNGDVCEPFTFTVVDLDA